MKQTFAFLMTGLLAVSLLTGCNRRNEAPAYVPKAITVETITVEKTDEPRWITIPGQAESGRAVEVRAQVTGILKKSLAHEGTSVHQGDVLYEIDPAPFKADLDLARAEKKAATVRLKQAELELVRASKLIQSGAVSQKVFDDALAEKEAAQAKFEQMTASEKEAIIRLGWTKIRAPESGFTGKNLVNPGALISSESTLLNTITEHGDLRIAFSASERTLDGAKITIANRVFITDERGNRYKAHLDFVAPDISPSSGTRLMRAKIEDTSELNPGDFVRVTLMTDVRKGVWRLPQKLIRQRPDGNYSVFVIIDGKARERLVEVDRWDGPDWIITKGLLPNDRIITTQLVRVREGTLVKTAEHP